MGMSIDEAMINLHAMQAYYNNDMLVNYVGFDRKDNESVDVAIDTMRKYQKVVQVLSDWKAMGYNENDGLYSLFSEVVEDGNVD